MKARLVLVAIFAAVLALHFCHSRVLWTEEELPLAAARQMLLGKALYRDTWFDKPPLVTLFYVPFGAPIGSALRALGAVYVWCCCVVAYMLGAAISNRRTGIWAACLLAFCLTFDTPSAVLPLAADLLTVLPHLACIYFAYRRRSFISGLCAGIAFAINVKALLILPAAAIFVWPFVIPLLIGFAVPCCICAGILFLTGSWNSYVAQVWLWPFVYAGSSHVADPILNGIARTSNWVGFHAALIFGACLAFWRRNMPRAPAFVFWLVISGAGVLLGARFFPRYFFQLLPVAVMIAACGLAMTTGWVRWAALALLCVPLVRFGPRYALLALNAQPDWSDLALDRDDQVASLLIRNASQPANNLYVWGYRPGLYLYTGLPGACRYLDSQAMTGVPADRHLAQSAPVLTKGTAAARQELARCDPDFIADGLSLFNPALSPVRYAELRPWLGRYTVFAQTKTFILYRKVVR